MMKSLLSDVSRLIMRMAVILLPVNGKCTPYRGLNADIECAEMPRVGLDGSGSFPE